MDLISTSSCLQRLRLVNAAHLHTNGEEAPWPSNAWPPRMVVFYTPMFAVEEEEEEVAPRSESTLLPPSKTARPLDRMGMVPIWPAS